MKSYKEARELAERLNVSIAQLREMFVFNFHYRKLDTTEIGSVFNCSEALVYNCLASGLRILK